MGYIMGMKSVLQQINLIKELLWEYCDMEYDIPLWSLPIDPDNRDYYSHQ